MHVSCRSIAKLGFVASAAALVIAAAIGAPRAAETAKTPVSLRFSWKLKGEYAPLYAALDKGYYGDVGLDVKLGEGAGSQAALASLLRGDDQAVWLPGIFALQAISKGMAVKLIALYNPAAPILIISWPDKPIRTPKDLEGKSIATAVGETGTTFLPVLCEKNHVDCSKITLVRMAIEARVPAFVAHKVDSVSVYRTNDLPILDAKFGKNAFVDLDEAKWGAGVPGSALVASDAYVQKHPEVLAKLVRAVDRGMAFSAKDPLAAAKIMLTHWSASLSPEVVAEQVKGLMGAVPQNSDKPMGYMDRKVLQDALNSLKAAGEVDSVKPVNAYYTNAIVEKASAK
jgi:NitT/TauT family transport system substrate-binding protein